MSIRDDAIRKIEPLVRSVAKKVSKDWDGIAEPEDVEQEIWMELLAESSEDWLLLLAELPDKNRTAAVNRIGRHVAERMREHYYQFSGNYTYDVDEVRELLEWGIHDFDGYSTRLFLQSEAADYTVGMERLKDRNSNYWAIIVNYYQLGQPAGDGTARKELSRAREALTREMNGARRSAEAEYGGR